MDVSGMQLALQLSHFLLILVLFVSCDKQYGLNKHVCYIVLAQTHSGYRR
jgi:hypothetical protein